MRRLFLWVIPWLVVGCSAGPAGTDGAHDVASGDGPVDAAADTGRGDVMPEAGADVPPDLAADVPADQAADVAVEHPADVAVEHPEDAPAEQAADGALDHAVDAQVDAGPAEGGSPADAHDGGCSAPALVDLGVLLDGTTSMGIDIDDAGDALVWAPNSMTTLAQGFIRSSQSTQNSPLSFLDPSQLTSLVALANIGIALGNGHNAMASRGIVCTPGCLVLPALGGQASSQSQAAAINDLGSIVGVSTTAAGPPPVSHAFLIVSSLQIQDLGTLGGGFSSATAIAPSSNSVVGQSALASGASHAFLWTAADGMRDLGTLGGTISSATAINDAGQVVGSSTTATGETHAFLWAAGTMRDLGTLGGTSSSSLSLNASGQVVGMSTNAAGAMRAFFWSAGSMQDLGTLGGSVISLPGGRRNLNDGGQVVGTSTTTGGASHGFVWRAGVMQDLGTLGGASSNAAAINVDGEIIGTSATASSTGHAFKTAPLTCP